MLQYALILAEKCSVKWIFIYPFVYHLVGLCAVPCFVLMNTATTCEHWLTVWGDIGVPCLLCLYLRVELLHYLVTLSLIFWGTDRLFSRVIILFCIPPNKVWGFPFHNETCYYLFFSIAVWVGVKWYFTVVLICISLMTSDV